MQIKIIIDWQVVIVPIVFGVLVTVLASLGAARSATSVTPLEAMRPLELTDQRKMKVGRAVIVLFALLVGMGLVGLSLWMQKDHGDSALLAAVGGCMFSVLGLALTAIVWMPWLMKGADALASLCGPSAKLADANIQKNPRRLAATGTALLIGVTLVSTLATGAAATSVTPLEAMRPLELTDQSKMKGGRAGIGLFALLVGMGLVGLSLWMQKDQGDSALLAAVGGCMFSFLGLALTAIFWMPWLMKGAGALAALCGPSAKLADANIQKNPRRIAATGTALLIGVTLVSTIATGAASAKATMNQALRPR